MSVKTQKMTIVKKGRKYFTVKCGGCVGQLVINDVSRNIQVGDILSIKYNDISEISQYGTKVKFEPVSILNEFNAEEEECKKWVYLATRDVEGGLYRTNACRKAISYDGKFAGDLQDTIDELKDLIETTKEAALLRDEEEREFTLEEADPITESAVVIKGGGSGWVGEKIYKLTESGDRYQTRMIEDSRSRSHRSGSMEFAVPTEKGVYMVQECEHWRDNPTARYMLISDNGKWYDIVPSTATAAKACLESL